MKKTIDYFFDEAPYWQVFVALFILLVIVIFSIFSFLFDFIIVELSVDILLIGKLTLTLALSFAFVGTLLTYIGRKSVLFWKEAKKLFNKLDEAETKETIDEIFNNDFQVLRKMSFGGAHYGELKRLHTIMQTKYKYLK